MADTSGPPSCSSIGTSIVSEAANAAALPARRARLWAGGDITIKIAAERGLARTAELAGEQ